MPPPFSIIVPFYNEEENVVAVLEEVRRCQPEAEVIAVDDGSSDATWEKICSVPGVRGLHPSANRGQSAAIYYGLLRAKADVVGLMDGDGQNDPADFAKLLAALGDNDVVVGYRAKRKDTASRRYASKFANSIRRLFLDDGVRDTGCSLKVFRKEAVQYLVPFNGLHRYLPAIFKKAGLKVAQVPVNHRARTAGISKYTNWERGLRGAYDLIGVSWLLKRKVHYPEIEEHTHDG
ncbi:MAG: glycosyltransferase family 2 protein [Verrucomicrobiota bacterium]